MTKPALLQNCVQVTDTLLVGGLEDYTIGLPSATVEGLTAAGVGCVINLLTKEQFQAADPAEVWGGTVEGTDPACASRKRRIFVTHSSWSVGEGILPTARQVRLTLDDIDDLHACNQTVLVNGAGYPARAAIAAGCWLARHRRDDDALADPLTARLGWLESVRGVFDKQMATTWTLDGAVRDFVGAWPPGRDAEPVRTRRELLDEEEPYPTATVEHWLHVLPTVRFYPQGRHVRRWADVPVLENSRIDNGADINLALADLRAGKWTGERTLRLLDGSAVVFISPHERNG